MSAPCTLRNSTLLVLLSASTIWGCSRPIDPEAARQAFGFGISESQTPIEIEARGRNFQWHFRYPGGDRQLGNDDDVTVAKDLHLPQNAIVELTLRSDDYIYIWSTPSLGLKEIAVPDLTHKLLLRADATGRFDIVTDPMCGWRFFHDDILGHVVIHSLAEFQNWSTQQLTETDTAEIDNE